MSISSLTLGIPSALDLTLQGSIGSFKIGASGKNYSLDVKYFLTHVGLNFARGPDEKLLRELEPVREIFDPQQLDFDEIMQRDIDDARVSSELIPYILDDRTQDLIKFFPPIVVMVLPITKSRNKPEPYYPEVNQYCDKTTRQGVSEWQVIRSGPIGSEVFQFEQPVLSGEPQKHNLVTLQLNTSRCKLVIVDGQHRAMALLALYRNLKDEWNEKRRLPFEKYYKEWTQNYIEQFDLDEINLPIIMCTVPTLDEKYQGDYNLKKAARSIFLTLNKTARKVSRTRNILLDDNDLISSFLRLTLGVIKDSDTRTASSLHIHSVELDQDKQRLNSPISITGVAHIYYIIQHILLDSGDVSGVSARSGRFGKRTTFSDALDRLSCVDLLGQELCRDTRRDVFTNRTEKALGEQFHKVYGNKIISMLQEFGAYEAHSFAAIRLRDRLESKDVELKSMLFEGQGIVRVFDDHRSNLKTKLKEGYFRKDVPKIRAIIENLDATDVRLKKCVQEFFVDRAEQFLGQCKDNQKFRDAEGKLSSEIVRLSNNLYGNVFGTVAFQSAIVCGFFNEFEKVSADFQGNEVINVDDVFSEYLSQLNEFFFPTSFSRFKKLLSLLFGRAEGGNATELTVADNSNDSFRSVVYPGEMQPDQWPKYRYLLLEIWKPTNEELDNHTKGERDFCRKQVFKALYERRKKSIAQELNKPTDDLEKESTENAFNKSCSDYSGFLKYLGRSGEVSEGKWRAVIHTADEGEEEEGIVLNEE